MTIDLNDERLSELAQSNYLMLKQSYCSVLQLKELVDRLHRDFLEQGGVPETDTVLAIKMTTDRLYDDLERYLRPECDPDSAYDEAMVEKV